MFTFASRDVDEAVERLESDPSEEIMLSLTLQTFPHIERQLPPELSRASMVFADEVHRSHADTSLTEELNRVLGRTVPSRNYTGKDSHADADSDLTRYSCPG